MMLVSIDPFNNEILKKYEEHTDHEIDAIINRTRAAFLSWRQSDFSTRNTLISTVARLLLERQEELSLLMTQEMGKLIGSSRAEIRKCARVCDYYTENAENFLEREYIKTEASRSFVTFNPLGVILAVMPWNFPFWQVFRFAVPGLMAGNACLLKHSSNVSGSALAIEKLFHDAGFPKDLLCTVLISSSRVDRIIKNPLIAAVTLTGSTTAGKAVAAAAGSEIKKTVLELGGNDPYIILDDADLVSAVETCVFSKMINAGQSCIAAKRFIVTSRNRDRFETAFVKRMKSLKMGDPRDPEIDLGPMARIDLRNELHDQVMKSLSRGAELLTGGYLPDLKGAFYPPTVITSVRKGMPAYDEELFGPVASIIPVRDEKEAIHVANDSSFGLGAAIFSRDLKKAESIAANEIESGSCFVNTYVKSDPRLPFGGIKNSGYGRELSKYGIREFVNTKTVYIP